MNSGESSPDLEVAAAFSGIESKHAKLLLTIAEERSSTCTFEDSLSECSESSFHSKQNEDILAGSKLHFYASRGKVKEVLEMLKQGADVDCLDRNDNTPLAWAASENQVVVATALLHHGANAGGHGPLGSPPLCHAALHGFMKIVDLLLERECYIDERNADGCTALMCAAYNGHKHIVAQLLRKGADLTIVNRWGSNAMGLANKRRQTETVACFDKYLRQILESR